MLHETKQNYRKREKRQESFSDGLTLAVQQTYGRFLASSRGFAKANKQAPQCRVNKLFQLCLSRNGALREKRAVRRRRKVRANSNCAMSSYLDGVTSKTKTLTRVGHQNRKWLPSDISNLITRLRVTSCEIMRRCRARNRRTNLGTQVGQVYFSFPSRETAAPVVQ